MGTAIDFLIDISDNMSKKLNIAQKAIKEEIIPLLDFSDSIGIRTFLSIAKSPIVINSIDLGETNRHDFTEKIDKLPIPNAGSPIGYTVKKSLEHLNEVEASRKRIILVTAGVETDGGNYEFEVEKNLKIDNVQVNIIGLGLSGFEEKTAQKTADMSHGCFCNIPLDKGDDSLAISNILQPLKDILNGKEVIPTPVAEPEPAPAPVPEVKPEPVFQEVKVEPITITAKEEEAPIINRVAAEPISEKKEEVKPEPAPAAKQPEVSVSFQPKETIIESKVEFQPTDRSQIQFQTEPDSKLASFSSFDKRADVQNINQQLAENNAQIEKLLKKNEEELKSFAIKQQESDREIAELRSAGQKAVATIEELKKLNTNANSEIDRLEKLLGEAQADIKKLTEAQNSAYAEIQRLKKIDEDVIILQDAEEISKNSRKNEMQIYEMLMKRYPGRVIWINKDEKKNMGYDFEIKFDDNSIEYYIAGKGIDQDRTFFLSKLEWEKCLKHSRNYQVYLVDKDNRIAIIDNLIGCILSGKVHPLAGKNQKVKAGNVQFSID
ncbi:MAG: DUF3883 domain-containing protein [Paludibacteraceae bacterium]|nr:DUF3883 domain-containing protein [Paludibacteraceae bacterium]